MMGDGKCVCEILSAGKSMTRKDMIMMIGNPSNERGERVCKMSGEGWHEDPTVRWKNLVLEDIQITELLMGFATKFSLN